MSLLRSVVRDVQFLTRLNRIVKTISKFKDEPTPTSRASDALEAVVDAHRDNPAIVFRGEVTAYAAFDALANRVAQWGLSQGLKPGDGVALLMPNRPEYLAIWFGLSKIGVVTALLNTHLKGQSLAHCVRIADANHILLDGALAGGYAEVAPALGPGVTPWVLASRQDGSNGAAAGEPELEGARSFDEALAAQPSSRPDPAIRAHIRGGDPFLRLFTSGTTGLPKAANVTHIRALNTMHGCASGAGLGSRDRVMLVLPLYHATGGLVGVGAALSQGGTLILEPSFSASRFWDVAAEQQATVFIYVGEICRFLATQPPHPRERDHALRLAIGNGLRPDVWPRFTERFAVPWIMEFYGSTEGNISMVNLDNTEGAVGRIPGFLRRRFNIRIFKFDHDKEQPVRGPDGRCVEADIGEAGEAMGFIDPTEGRFRFEGYTGAREQTEKKLMRDVLEEGDLWFRSGDLLRRDENGYMYFVDRVGDTFRWKSENVATSEVAEVLSVFPGVKQANVYGVATPGYDGRAGMAALVADDNLDLGALAEHVARELPVYARPVFIRIHGEAPTAHTTGTFKFRKVDLVAEGFDPAATADTIYVADAELGYRPLDHAGFQAIQDGRVRL